MNIINLFGAFELVIIANAAFTGAIKRILPFGVLMLLLSGSSSAALITYTHAGTGSGAVGSTIFSNSNFVITAMSDTTNREDFGSHYSLAHDIASIDISGVGIFTFITETRIYLNKIVSGVGFSRASGSDLVNSFPDPAFSGWGMDTSIGPITGIGEIIQWNDFSHADVITTGGILYFDDDFSTPITFQATVVPIPTAAWLFGSGLLGLIGIARRKKS